MKEFLASLLTSTQEEFREAFTALAQSKNNKDQRKFAALYCNLLEFTYGNLSEKGGKQ